MQGFSAQALRFKIKRYRVLVLGKHVTGHADESKLPEDQASLLEHFAPRGLLRRLADFDPASGQLPLEAVLRGNAFTEQYPLPMGYHHRYSTAHGFVEFVNNPLPDMASEK